MLGCGTARVYVFRRAHAQASCIFHIMSSNVKAIANYFEILKMKDRLRAKKVITPWMRGVSPKTLATWMRFLTQQRPGDIPGNMKGYEKLPSLKFKKATPIAQGDTPNARSKRPHSG